MWKTKNKYPTCFSTKAFNELLWCFRIVSLSKNIHDIVSLNFIFEIIIFISTENSILYYM